MLKRLSFVIVYLILLIPSFLINAVIIFFGSFGCLLLWIILGKDLDDTTDKVFDLVSWIIEIPYKMFWFK